MWGKLANFFTGGLAETVMSGIEKYFPPDMTEQEKAQLKLALEKIELQKQTEANKAIAEAEKSINERIAQHEGTANDLKSLPFVGRVVIFARGCQRPLWGFGVMWADLQWFSGNWTGLTQQQESALWVINLLVLGFLFGERAVKNLMPIISKVLAK